MRTCTLTASPQVDVAPSKAAKKPKDAAKTLRDTNESQPCDSKVVTWRRRCDEAVELLKASARNRNVAGLRYVCSLEGKLAGRENGGKIHRVGEKFAFPRCFWYVSTFCTNRFVFCGAFYKLWCSKAHIFELKLNCMKKIFILFLSVIQNCMVLKFT